MVRFLPLAAGLIHAIITVLILGSSAFWDLYIFNGILAVTSLWLAYKREWLIASAISLWTFGSIFSSIVERSNFTISSLWSGIGYLAFYPLVFFYIVKSQQLKKLTRSQFLDSLIITLGISSLVVAFTLAAASNANSSLEIFLITLYPVGDLLLIFLIFLLGSRSGISREYLLIFNSILIFTLSDVGYLWLYSKNQYSVGGLIDEGWLIALLLLAAAPKIPVKSSRTLNTYPAIFLAMALALCLLGWYSLDPTGKSRTLLIPAIGTLLLAFIRMALALDEAEQGKIHRQHAVTDELTGVGNRREFLTRLADIPSDGTHSLMLLDLDGFKIINDQLGHTSGDLVLREIAHRFQAALPGECYLARLGGDEFGVLLAGGSERAQELAERLQRSLAIPIYVGERALDMRVSIGATPIEPGTNPLELADQRMYLAKRSAR